MLNLNTKNLTGAIRSGWSAVVEDYAIDAGWSCSGTSFVVADAAGGVFAFDGRTGATRWSHRGVHDGGALCMDIHPNTKLVATGGQDGRVLLWNAEDGHLTKSIDLGGGWIEHLSWSDDGRFLAASNSRCVHMHSFDGHEIWRSEKHPSTVSALAWSKSKELATACYGRVAFYTASSGELGQKLEWKGSLVSMVLSPNGDIVACGSQDNSVHFWRRSTGQDSMMSGYPGKPSALAFDSSGTLLATGGGEVVTVWSFRGNGPEGTTPGSLKLHPESVTSLTFAPNQRRLASGARDGSVVVWDLGNDGNGAPVGAAQIDAVIAGLAWRPDGRGLVAFDGTGGVTAWRLSK